MPPNAGSRRFKCHSTLRPSADNAAATRSAPPAAQLLGDAGWSIPRNKGASNWAPQLLRNPCCLSFCPKAHTHACVARQVPTHAPTRLCWRPQSRHREGIAVAAGSRRAAPSRFARSHRRCTSPSTEYTTAPPPRRDSGCCVPADASTLATVSARLHRTATLGRGAYGARAVRATAAWPARRACNLATAPRPAPAPACLQMGRALALRRVSMAECLFVPLGLGTAEVR